MQKTRFYQKIPSNSIAAACGQRMSAIHGIRWKTGGNEMDSKHDDDLGAAAHACPVLRGKLRLDA